VGLWLVVGGCLSFCLYCKCFLFDSTVTQLQQEKKEKVGEIGLLNNRQPPTANHPKSVGI